MRILLVSQEYPPETAHGGIGTQTYMRAHGLVELGHDVFVISHSTDNKRHDYKDKNVNIIRIPNIDHRFRINSEYVRWLTYSTEVAVAIKELHSRKSINLIVFPEWGGEGYVYLLNRTQEDYIPVIVHIHGPIVMFANTMGWPDINSEFYRIAKHMEETCFRLADAISASNKCSAGWCIKHYGLNEQEIPVLYTGIDTSLFFPINVEKEKRPTIIFVGSVRRTKGVDLLVDAACILANEKPHLQLIIIGRGDESFIKELKNKALSAGYSDLLDMPGRIDRKDLPLYLSKAHIFAAPSVYEGGPGNVYIEAMACGLPVIACSGSGIDGIIVNNENGVLVPPNNLEDLSIALRNLLNNKSLSERLGNAARINAMHNFDSKESMKRLGDFYVKISRANDNVKT